MAGAPPERASRQTIGAGTRVSRYTINTRRFLNRGTSSARILKAKLVKRLHVRTAQAAFVGILYWLLYLLDKFLLRGLWSDGRKKKMANLYADTVSDRCNATGTASATMHDLDGYRAAYLPAYHAFTVMKFAVWILLFGTCLRMLRGNFDWTLFRTMLQGWNTLVVCVQLAAMLLLDASVRYTRTSIVDGWIAWAHFVQHTSALCLLYLFFIATDAMVVTSVPTRRVVAVLFLVVVAFDWLIRVLTIVHDEASVNLLHVFGDYVDTTWSAQDAIKTLDYGMLVVTAGYMVSTYRDPELVVFMPMRFARTELLVHLRHERERHELRTKDAKAKAKRKAGDATNERVRQRQAVAPLQRTELAAAPPPPRLTVV